MTDLDQWQREQVAANRRAARMAMYRLSQRHGWGIPHPAQVAGREINERLRKGMQALGRAAAKFVNDYRALERMFP